MWPTHPSKKFILSANGDPEPMMGRPPLHEAFPSSSDHPAQRNDGLRSHLFQTVSDPARIVLLDHGDADVVHGSNQQADRQFKQPIASCGL